MAKFAVTPGAGIANYASSNSWPRPSILNRQARKPAADGAGFGGMEIMRKNLTSKFRGAIWAAMFIAEMILGIYFSASSLSP